ncbi:HAD family hydrolase [Cypionkella psychrotolerans]|uniref:HAD family hydrolase n=1 Tax=Cypionkella psychrotolerans TaxID=1678131 RepID=UPI0006B4C37D|nr:HAD family hydrolase [Cypionkella psychrotolerans]
MTKTITLDVSACFGGLDHLGVTKQLLAEAGVQALTPNPGSTSVIVRFDETVTSVAKRRKVIAACGQHCRAEATPRHVCTPEDLPDGAMPAPVKREPHAGHDKAEMATEIKPAQDHAVDDVLRAAATLERGSDHPLSVGLVNCDAQAEIGEALIYLANRRLMHEQKIDLGLLGQQADLLRGDGRTVVHVGQGGKILGLIAIADAVRPSAKATVAKLREGRVQVAMLTVDNANTTQHIAEELGIDIVLADVLPDQQTNKNKEFASPRQKGRHDRRRRARRIRADSSRRRLTIGAGTGVAMESDPYDVVGAIVLLRATPRKMHQNLFWAMAYNIIAFPATAGVFYRYVVGPEVAALAMSGSSAMAAVNALLLKRTWLEEISKENSRHRLWYRCRLPFDRPNQRPAT